jgi:4-oxalomesaconate tautomerase
MDDHRGVPCILMRGGTSRGAYFLASDLPVDTEARDSFLARALGAPDPNEVDGIGGGHPLTSKVAVVSRSGDPDADVDYLFLQVWPDTGAVTADQTCGNILAGVGPFAIERELVRAVPGQTRVRIRIMNGGGGAVATVQTPGGVVSYAGSTLISGVSRPAAAVLLDFESTVGSTTGSLLPTGAVRDRILGVDVTCIDNGMPVVVLAAADLGIRGDEAPEVLESDPALLARIRTIRLEAGQMMGLGDVTGRTIPKVTLVSWPADGEGIGTRTFIPERCHTSIGVLGGVAVATAAGLPGSVAAPLLVAGSDPAVVRLEHPTGFLDVRVGIDMAPGTPTVRSAVVRTARKLFEGEVFA